MQGCAAGVSVGVKGAAGTEAVVRAGSENDLATELALGNQLSAEGRFNARAFQLDDDPGIDGQPGIGAGSGDAERNGIEHLVERLADVQETGVGGGDFAGQMVRAEPVAGAAIDADQIISSGVGAGQIVDLNLPVGRQRDVGGRIRRGARVGVQRRTYVMR